jgi:hypothetical protein
MCTTRNLAGSLVGLVIISGIGVAGCSTDENVEVEYRGTIVQDGVTAPVGTVLHLKGHWDTIDPKSGQVVEPSVNFIVQWTPTGGGSIAPTATTTDDNGDNSADWTLGPTVGPQSVKAELVLKSTPASLVVDGTIHFNARATADLCAGPGGTDHAGGTLTANETWDATGNPHRVNNGVILQGVTLTLGPGTVVCLNGTTGTQIVGLPGSRVVAVGTAAAPILFTAISPVVALYWGNFQLSGNATDTSYFVHTRIEYAAGGIQTTQPVVLDSSVIRQIRGPGLSLSATARGSRILRSRIDTVRSVLTSGAGVAISAPDVEFSSAVHGAGTLGIQVTAGATNVSFDHCEVTGSGADGVTTDAVIAIHNCNFSDNVGNAVAATSGVTVDATNNWWGDPAGPTGPAGDGVSGNVNYTPFLTSKVTLGYAPPAPTAARTPRRTADH